MADISTELAAIQNAVYGEEVRGAIVDALEAMNESADSAEMWATGGTGGTASATNNAKYYSEKIGSVSNNFINANAYDVLQFCDHPSVLNHGVQFTFDDDLQTCTIAGTASGGAAYTSLFVGSNGFPRGMEAGKTYRLKYSSQNVWFQVWKYKNGVYDSTIFATKSDKIFSIPDDASGVSIRFAVSDGVTVNETVFPLMFSEVPTNAELKESIDQKSEDIARQIKRYNAYDIFDGIFSKNNNTISGVSFTWQDDVCTVDSNGVATESVAVNVLLPSAALPDGVEAGKRYFLKVETTNTYLQLRAMFRDANDVLLSTQYFNQNAEIIIPDGAAKWTWGVYTSSGHIYDNDTISGIAMLNTYTNEELYNKSDRVYLYDNATHGGYFNLGSAFDDLNFFRDTQRAHVDPLYSRILIPVTAGSKVSINTIAGATNAKPYAVVDYAGVIREVYNGGASFNGQITIEYDGWVAVNIVNSYSKKFRCEVSEPFNSITEMALFGNFLPNNQYTRLPNYDNSDVCKVVNRGPSWAGFLHHWGIVGASFDSGELNYRIKVYPTQEDAEAGTNETFFTAEYEGYEYSCWEWFAKVNGIPDLYHYANGGQNARDWIRSTGVNQARTFVYSGEKEQCSLLSGYYDANNHFHYWRVPAGTGWSDVREADGGYTAGGNYAPYRVGFGKGKAGGNWPKMLEDYQNGIVKQVFVVNLGSNDLNNNYPHDETWAEDWTGKSADEYYTCGTIADIGTYDLATDTDTLPDGGVSGVVEGVVNSYAAYIGAILNRIIAIQPKAIIFLCTIRSGFGNLPNRYEVWNEYNDTLRQIAAMDQYKNNVILLDNAKFGPAYSLQPLTGMVVGAHLNAAGYQYIAGYWNTLIDHAIQSNFDRFKEASFIGTDKTYAWG